MKTRKMRKVVASVFSVILSSSMLCGTSSALVADDVLNETTDELQQCIIDYIFVKNYISGNIILSNDFSKKLDMNNDGYTNIIDLNHL